MTSSKQTVFIFKNMSSENATLAALLKPLRTRSKPPNPNQIILFTVEKNFLTGWKDKHPEWQIAVFWPWGCPHCHAQPEIAEGQPDGPLVGGNVASQLNRLQLFRLFYVVRFWERGQ
jgi:hypothetical protein